MTATAATPPANPASAISPSTASGGRPRPGLRDPFGVHLRHWRQRRRRSQLDLAQEVEVSTRHLSYVETGRAAWQAVEWVLQGLAPRIANLAQWGTTIFGSPVGHAAGTGRRILFPADARTAAALSRLAADAER